MTQKTIKSSECKCIECGKQAIAFYPAFDPDIKSYPYCRKCLDEKKLRELIAFTTGNDKFLTAKIKIQ